MAAALADAVLDRGLSWLVAQASELHVCGSEPTDYATTIAASLGHGTAVLAGPSPAASGRSVALPETGFTATSGGSTTWWAITSASAALLAHGVLTDPITIVATQPCTIAAFSITLPKGPAA